MWIPKLAAYLTLATVMVLHPPNIVQAPGHTETQEHLRMTVTQWFEWGRRDNAAASRRLLNTITSVKGEAVEHYAKKGNMERARAVQGLDPNVKEIIGRLAYAKVTEPNALVEDVVRGYFIAATETRQATAQPKN